MAGIWSNQDSADLIVGRQRERERLRRLLARALDGEGSLALVSGEAGIGKSTLVGELQPCRRREAGCAGPGWRLLRPGNDAALWPLGRDHPHLPGRSRLARPSPMNCEQAAGMARIDSQAALFDLAGRFFRGGRPMPGR